MFLRKITPPTLVFLLFVSTGFAQSNTPAPPEQQSPPLPIEEIIRRFAEKEKQFKTARASYTYRQDVKVQELDSNDRVTGEWNQVSDILFDSSGKRTEKMVYVPAPSLKRISMTSEDLQDLREIQPFVLTSDDIQKYNLKYGGREKIDEVGCYVFDVAPKKIEKNQR
jgi:outer membrane lipoprotein-sorting protein